MILAKKEDNSSQSSFSRVCGGDPLKGANLEDADLLFPAYAGVIPFSLATGQGARTFSRICGGDPKHVSYEG